MSPLPPPEGISDEARAYLTRPRPYGEATPPSDPDDTEGWLAYVDAADAGMRRMLSGLFPVGDLPVTRHERDVDGVTTYVLRPDHVADEPDAPVYLELHGGALILGGGEACAEMATMTCLGRDMVTWAPDYRMPPHHPYPAGLDDAVTVYRRLLEERDAGRVVVGGPSAGGNLASALLLRARDEGLPMPAALVLLSPEVDLTESGDSFTTHGDLDHVLDSLMAVNRLYADGHDLADPFLSPLFGDLTGFPPTFLQSGTRDLFLSNTVRMHRALLDAGVEAELHVWDAMPHGGFGGAPEDIEVAAAVAHFTARHLA